MSLWTSEAAAAATGGRARGWGQATGIAIDNREVVPGDLFIALKGENHDGHAFAADALKAGAVAAMVHDMTSLPDHAPVLQVDDTFAALQQLGRAGRMRSSAKIIAVTGSVGKTSTKDMLHQMLSAQARTHAAVRSFNNHWGVPLTLARMPVDAEYAVIEIGMNHAGEITPLSKLARPHIALITTVEAVHLAAFNGIEEIADAKAEIFAGLEPDGTAILPADNPHFLRLRAQAEPHEILTFGENGGLARLVETRISGDVTVVRAEFNEAPLTFKIGTPGAHFARNALAALAAVHCAGADPVLAALDLASWAPPSGRGSKAKIALEGGELILLDESYNANPASLGAALDVLAATNSRGRKVAILGDMLELGPDQVHLHKRMSDHAAMNDIDVVHCCGPLMRHLHDILPRGLRGIWAEDSAALAARVPSLLREEDTVMVKGSLGARMAVVVKAIKALAATDEG